MPLPMHQARAVARLAQALYDYLPGSGAQQWRGHISFATLARQEGLGDFWTGGSKLPAITLLLDQTLDRRPDRFQPLILAIVRSGLLYREKNGRPVTRRDIEELNRVIADIGFKFPDLWSPRFLGSLPEETTLAHTDGAVPEQIKAVQTQATLEELKAWLLELHAQPDRSTAGLALERLLNVLFALANLAPRGSFRVVGEQIDGSFVLENQTYLVEAKWTAGPIREDELLIFYGKVSAKSSFTRGVFVSLNGFTAPALDAITRGKQPNSVLMDGADLWQVLEGRITLADLLAAKVRRLAEEGRVFIPARELLG
jgi:hypothetical protein